MIVHGLWSIALGFSILFWFMPEGNLLVVWQEHFRLLGRGLAHPGVRYYTLALVFAVILVPLAMGIVEARIEGRTSLYRWVAIGGGAVLVGLATTLLYTIAVYFPPPGVPRYGGWFDGLIRFGVIIALLGWNLLVLPLSLLAHGCMRLIMRRRAG